MKISSVKCPTCGKRGDWFSGAFGPFCSRRCKLLDLGKWFSEEHAISEPLKPDSVPDPDDAPPIERRQGRDEEQ